MDTLPSLPTSVSELFNPERWRDIEGTDFHDITMHRGVERSYNDQGNLTGVRDMPVVRIAFNRPEVRNAFRPETVDELYRALDMARLDTSIGAVIVTGNGPSPKDGVWAFCSGGDQKARGRDGYQYAASSKHESASANPSNTLSEPKTPLYSNTTFPSTGRLHILEVQRLIRTMGKIVIAAIPGWAAGGGHSLEVVCDLAIASREHARFKQVDANVGSFDAGYGSQLLARQVGDRRAREIFFLAREYSAEDAERWGAINEAVSHKELEERAWEYAMTVCSKSPQAIRMLKLAFNAADDGMAGMQVFAGEATRLAYMTDEAREGRDSFLERREADWSSFPYYA